jgi:hypothetical protein
MKDPGVRRPIGNLLEGIRIRINSLQAFGVDAGPLHARLDDAQTALGENKKREARLVADELLIFIKILNAEVERFIREFSQGKGIETVPAKESDLDQRILDLVQEAFQRSLHGTSFRKMVEMIATEKVQILLSDDYVTKSDLEVLGGEPVK